MSSVSAVFLDRDGTMNVKAAEDTYVLSPDELRLLPGVAEAIGRLGDAGIPVFVVTNQRGVARGVMTVTALDAVHDRLRSLLARAGVSVDGIYSCVHDISACNCRKPKPGLLRQVVRDHPQLDLARSWVIGDAASDVAAGAAAGCATIRVADVTDPAATVTVGSLPKAVDWLLS